MYTLPQGTLLEQRRQRSERLGKESALRFFGGGTATRRARSHDKVVEIRKHNRYRMERVVKVVTGRNRGKLRGES